VRAIEIPEHLSIGVVEAAVTIGPSTGELSQLLVGEGPLPSPFEVGAESRQPTYDGIRNLLRHAGYKPSGRNKPAAEYLNKAFAKDGLLPSIFNVVDVNNVVSLYSGLPISIFDASRLAGDLVIRPGGEGDSYVFNKVGQELSLKHLLTVHYRSGDDLIPAGNAVKDSMATKVHEGTERVIAVVYSRPDALLDQRLSAAVDWYESLLRTHCGATDVDTAIYSAGSKP
jgi:DNA/RNA-binding domain of Phe-tRNA-synthetase-like protein